MILISLALIDNPGISFVSDLQTKISFHDYTIKVRRITILIIMRSVSSFYFQLYTLIYKIVFNNITRGI